MADSVNSPENSREHPWHARRLSVKHYESFQGLVAFHELTQAWLADLKIDQKSNLISRGVSSQFSADVWMLASLAKAKLEDLLDDSTPDELLSRIEHTVWGNQVWTLMNLQAQTSGVEKSALQSRLEQTSFKVGREYGAKRWPKFEGSGDLRRILLAMIEIPLFSGVGSEALLICRSVPHAVKVELRVCPHQRPFSALKDVQDLLCQLHNHWMRGYAYSLNSKIVWEYQPQRPRCTQNWRLPEIADRAH